MSYLTKEMSEEKIKYRCNICDEEFGVVFVVKEEGKIKNKCTDCFYGKEKEVKKAEFSSSKGDVD